MNIRKTGVSAALAAAVVVAGAGISHADVASTPASPSSVTYQARLENKTVVTTIDKGTFVVSKGNKFVAVQDAAGKEVTQLPLTMHLDGKSLPLKYEVSTDRHTLRLTPEAALPANAALATTPDKVKEIASLDENQAAANQFLTTVGMGTTVGSLIGLAAGAAIGVVLGVLGAGAACIVLSVGCLVTALPILATVATVGGIAGTVLVGGPALLYAGFDYVSTLTAAPGTSKYARR